MFNYLIIVLTVVNHDDWNNVPLFALDNNAMRNTVFVYCKVVIIHEKGNNQISDYLILSYNIRFLSRTLTLISMFLS